MEWARPYLKHVIGDVEDPESDDEDTDGTGLGGLVGVVAGGHADIGCESDEEDGGGDEGGAGGDEGAAAAESAGASVGIVSDEWLDDHAGDGSTEPDEGGPGVGNTEELDVRRQEGQL